MSEDIRWKQRFENFNKAYGHLCDALEATAASPDNELYQIALISTFQFNFELAWKTLKDYLNYSGIVVSLPRDVIKHAFQQKLIVDGQLWIDMLESRNLMAHVYEEEKAIEAGKNIRSQYIHGIKQVRDLLESKLKES